MSIWEFHEWKVLLKSFRIYYFTVILSLLPELKEFSEDNVHYLIKLEWFSVAGRLSGSWPRQGQCGFGHHETLGFP